MLYGIATTSDGLPYANATVEVKGEDFATLYSAVTDQSGHYSIDLPDGNYPFLIAVKDYAETCLEYWAHNVPVAGSTELNPRFESLEVYGLNAFRVKGSYPSLHLYFRPMSLAKFRENALDIAPVIKEIRIIIDGTPVKILHQSKVGEYIGDRTLTVFLLQVSLPENASDWQRIDVEITDPDGHFGMATLFA